MALALRAASPCGSAILPIRRTRVLIVIFSLRQPQKDPLAGVFL